MSNPEGVSRPTGAGSMDTNLYRPATTCDVNMPIYTPFSTSASNKFIHKHHMFIPFQTTPFQNTPGDSLLFFGRRCNKPNRPEGNWGGKILKNKSITKSKLFSYEQSRESVECTSLSPPRGTSTSIYRCSTTKSLRVLIKAPFLSKQNSSRVVFSLAVCTPIRFCCI